LLCFPVHANIILYIPCCADYAGPAAAVQQIRLW
jgi:hypothetical protein